LSLTSSKRKLVNLLLVAVSFFALWGATNFAMAQKTIPSTAQLLVEQVRQEEDDLFLTLFVSDAIGGLRWLSPKQLVLATADKCPSGPGDQLPDVGALLVCTEVIKPQSIIIVDGGGERIDAGSFHAAIGAMRIELKYALPPKSEPGKDWMALYQLSEGVGQLIQLLPRWESK
jgi:hypothetical protein